MNFSWFILNPIIFSDDIISLSIFSIVSQFLVMSTISLTYAIIYHFLLLIVFLLIFLTIYFKARLNKVVDNATTCWTALFIVNCSVSLFWVFIFSTDNCHIHHPQLYWFGCYLMNIQIGSVNTVSLSSNWQTLSTFLIYSIFLFPLNPSSVLDILLSRKPAYYQVVQNFGRWITEHTFIVWNKFYYWI